MTTLFVYADRDGTEAVITTTDPDEIQATLAAANIDFERWKTDVEVSGDDPLECILDSYEQRLVDLKRRGGYRTADVIALTPESPKRVQLRQQFLSEHIHTEDEVRFFVAGRGAFYLHISDRVFIIICERGDLLRVPANTRHWFDMGPAPSLVVIRVFTDPKGWVAQFTSDNIAQRFPRFEPGGLLT